MYIGNLKKLLIVIFLLVQAFSEARAKQQIDTLSVNVYFKAGMRSFDPSYKENGVRLSSFIDLVRGSASQENASSSVHLLIRSGSSPEGNTRTNEILAHDRARFLKGYLSDILPLSEESFVINSVGEDWENLYKAIAHLDEPWADDALDIIANTPIWVKDATGSIVDSRKNRLKNLADGQAWETLRTTVFLNECAKAEISAIIPSSSMAGTVVPTDNAMDSTPVLATRSAKSSGPRRLADYFQWQSESDTLPATSLEIQFRLDRTDIDMDFSGNNERFLLFLREFNSLYAGIAPSAIQIDIYAGASPEGPADHNKELGEGRCNAIRDLLINALGSDVKNIITHNLSARWDDFFNSVAESAEPWRDEVLAIIRMNPSDDGTVRDHREVKLRELREGTVWPQLLSGYLAPLRSGGSAVVSVKTPLPVPSSTAEQALELSPVKDTVFLIADTVLARKNCVPIPLRRLPSSGCPTRIALSPEYLSTLSALVRDTLNIRFRLDSTRIDLNYAGNRYRVQRFLEAFSNKYDGMRPSTMRLDIYAGASPEGTAAHNEWLGRERGASIRRLIRDSLGIKVTNIQIHNQAARWDEFYDAIARSDEPWKHEVLEIIREEPSRDPNVRDHREIELRSLHGGAIWPILLEKYLSPLRSGSSAQLSIDPGIDPSVLLQRDRATSCGETGWQFSGDTLWICGGNVAPAQRDTVVIMQNTPYGMYPYDNYPWDNLPEGYYFDSRGYLRTRQVKKTLVPADKTPAWAVKTNLLFWGIVAPNISVEIPLGRRNRWSLEWEYDHPWFIWSQNSHASQILNMSLELRLYLGNRDYHRWLDGWHIGLAFGGGKYDWEWKQHEGWQGEFINPYFNFGYQHRWGKHWAIDAGMGIGVIPSRYRHYYGGSVYPDNHLEPWDVHLIWHDTGHFVYPGITHVNVSISYMFNNWPLLIRDMSERKRQQWSDTYNERMKAEREARYQKEKARTERANARDEAKEQQKAMKKAARQARKAQNAKGK